MKEYGFTNNMLAKQTKWLILVLTLLWACDKNYKNVVITATVTDSLTGEGVANAKIRVISWEYDAAIDESKANIDDAVSDNAGRISVTLEKAEAFDIEVSHSDYESLDYSQTLEKSENSIQLRLKRLE